MQPFLGEMETFRSLASEVREKERVVLVGANPWFRETRYFYEWVLSLRRSSRIDVKLVDVCGGMERSMVDSGGCDVYVGPTDICGKRLSNVGLPSMEASIGMAGDQSAPICLEELGAIGVWGIHLPRLRSKAAEWLRCIELAGGGKGRLISDSDFLEWSANPLRSQLQAVIAPMPAASSRHQRVVWQPFRPLDGIRITATALSLHPYDFLGSTIQAAAANLMEHDGSL